MRLPIHYRTKRNRLFLALLAWVACVSLASAQTYQEIEYLVADGLPSVQVSAVNQAEDGSMLVMTREGLARFDGHTWEVDAELEKLMPEGWNLTVTPSGKIYVAGRSLNREFAVHEDGDWQILPSPITSSTARISAFEPAGIERETLMVSSSEGDVFAWDGEFWADLSPPASLGVTRLWAMACRGDEVYVATDAGMFSIGGMYWGSPIQLPPGADEKRVVGLGCTEEHGDVYILGKTWLAKLDPAGGIEMLSTELDGIGADGRAYPRSGGWPFPVVPDGNGGAIFGYRMGIGHFNAIDERVVTDPFPSSFDGASVLFRDRDENIWVACMRGLRRIPSLRFANYDADELIAGAAGLVEVSAMIETQDGTLVAAHRRGLSFMEDGSWSHLDLPDSDLGWPLGMAVDPDGRLWIVRGGGQIMRRDPGGEFEPVTADAAVGLTARSIFCDQQGQIWVTAARGAAYWNGSAFQLADFGVGDISRVRVVRQFEDGYLWLATEDGLWADGEDGWQWYSHKGLDGANDVIAAHKDSRGRILVATYAGLFEAKDGKLIWLALGDEFVREPIYSLTAAPGGVLWIGTQDGLLKWSGSSLRRLSLEQGLIGRETNRAAALVDQDGRFWSGGVGGASCYYEDFDHGLGAAPLLGPITIEVDGEPVLDALDLTVDNDVNDVVFSFHATSFIESGAVEYACFLRGYDHEWQGGEALASGQLRYTSLPPGKYRLLFRAKSATGIWSSVQSSSTFKVKRPAWQSFWLLSLVVLALGTLGWGINNLVYQRRRGTELEREVRAKTADLRFTVQRFRSLFEKSRAPQLLLDADRKRIAGANQAASDLYGLSVAALVGMEFNDLRSDEGASDPVRSGIGGQVFADRHRVAGGDDIEVEIYLSTFEEGGRFTTQAIIQDTTERQRLQEQLLISQRMESVGLLAGGIAHDFNNLLTVVLSNAELALKELGRPIPRGDQLRQGIGEVREAGQRAASITHQLLSFSRRQVAELKVVDVNRVLMEMEQMILRLTRDSVVVEINSDPDLLPSLVDEVQLQQVIMNLVINANDAMPTGGQLIVATTNVELTVEDLADNSIEPGDFVALTVTDTGEGISESAVASIFDPFFSTKPVGKGTGLGLAMVHGIVHQSGGLVRVRSVLGEGARFEVLLPATSDESAYEVPAAAPVRELEPSGGEKIFLCEDDRSVRVLTSRILTDHGYVVQAFSSPFELLKTLADESVELDLLITDVMMPEMGGRELASKAMDLWPGLRVLFISGYAPELDNEISLNTELALLQKPYRPAELLHRVRMMLGGGSATESPTPTS
ncbi:MAG: PAS domain S-box-containing protein [Planctomycetota bacterium]|jgi:PAS domain S-box-containing protein